MGLRQDRKQGREGRRRGGPAAAAPGRQKFSGSAGLSQGWGKGRRGRPRFPHSGQPKDPVNIYTLGRNGGDTPGQRRLGVCLPWVCYVCVSAVCCFVSAVCARVRACACVCVLWVCYVCVSAACAPMGWGESEPTWRGRLGSGQAFPPCPPLLLDRVPDTRTSRPNPAALLGRLLAPPVQRPNRPPLALLPAPTWLRGCAGGSMGRVVARVALAAHLGHRPGTCMGRGSAGGGGSCPVPGWTPSLRAPPSATARCRPRPLLSLTRRAPLPRSPRPGPRLLPSRPPPCPRPSSAPRLHVPSPRAGHVCPRGAEARAPTGSQSGAFPPRAPRAGPRFPQSPPQAQAPRTVQGLHFSLCLKLC